MTTAPPPYAVELPDEEELGRRLRDAEEMWIKRRNPFIFRMRAHLSGSNPIILPQAKGWTPYGVHTFGVLSVGQRRLARFGYAPEMDVLPVGQGDPATNRAARVRRATVGAFDVIGRKHLGVWRRAARDALMLGTGVTEMVNCTMGDWPDLVPDKKVAGVASSPMTRAYPDPDAYAKASADYKKRAGFPIEEHYVALERMYPVFENGKSVENFKVEQRTLRSILNNPLFDTTELYKAIDFAEKATRSEVPLSSRVTLLTYTNQAKYGYYAYARVSNGITFPGVGEMAFDKAGQIEIGQSGGGTPIFLYECDHDLGRLPYAFIPGAYGVWEDPENEIEDAMEALIQLGQARDELRSQAATMFRVTHWPTTVTKIGERRGRTLGDVGDLQIEEGGNFKIYSDEEITRLFEPINDPMYEELDRGYDEAMQELGGGMASFVGQGAGGDSGYGENLRIAVVQDLENMAGEGLKEGMRDRVHLLWAHVKAIGEEIPVQWVERGADTQPKVQNAVLNPADFEEQLPAVVVDVTRPKQIDMVGAGRVFLDLTNDRGGKGPALSDRSGRIDILGVKDNEAEERQIMFEKSKQMALASPVYNQGIMQKLALLRANGTTNVTQDMVNQADPTLLQGIQGMAASGAAGPLSPGLMNKVLGATQDQPPEVKPSGLAPGATPGQAQPQQAVGIAASKNVGPTV